MSQPQGATKWYTYSSNWRVGNDILIGPLHCPGVRLMQTSNIREIISDLWPLWPCRSSGELNWPVSEPNY